MTAGAVVFLLFFMHLHCPELLYPSREATMEPDSRDPYEELEGTLDPHRKEERDAAVAEVAARLRGRGVTVTGTEPPDDLANLLTAVERFEAAVEAHGGGLMVDDLKSREPDDRHFVLPRRGQGGAGSAVNGPVEDATARLRQHPRRRD